MKLFRNPGLVATMTVRILACPWSVLSHAEPLPAEMISRTAVMLSLASQVVSNKEGTIVGLLGASPGRLSLQ